MFDFADVTALNSVLENSIHLYWLLFIGDCYSRDTQKRTVLTRENRKNLLTFIEFGVLKLTSVILRSQHNQEITLECST